MPALLRMFDRMDWRRPPTAPFERIHGPGCECNPESALRIQATPLPLSLGCVCVISGGCECNHESALHI